MSEQLTHSLTPKCMNRVKYHQHDVILSKPQLNLNTSSTVVGFDMKMTVQTTPPTPTPHHHTNSMSAISQLLLTRF